MKQKTSVIFFGSYPMSLMVLQKMTADPQIDLRAVITQPTQQPGRIFRNFLLEWCCEFQPGLPIYFANSPTEITKIFENPGVCADFLISCWYPFKVPEGVINRAQREALNIHPSLLPKYRGSDPVRRVMMAGDKVTGVTVHRLTNRFDAGPVVGQRVVPVPDDVYLDDLVSRLGRCAGDLILEIIRKSMDGVLSAESQDDSVASFAPSLTAGELEVDDTTPLKKIYHLVRACFPWKKVTFSHHGQTVILGKILETDFSKSRSFFVERHGESIRISGFDGCVKFAVQSC